MKKKILVVDDDLFARKSIQALLEAKSFQVEEAASGKEALEWVRNNSDLGLILLDMRMPNMDGLDTLRAIREIGPTIPVIIVTAFPEDERVKEALTLGVSRCMTKPLQQVELEKLTEVVSRQH